MEMKSLPYAYTQFNNNNQSVSKIQLTWWSISYTFQFKPYIYELVGKLSLSIPYTYEGINMKIQFQLGLWPPWLI